jgi:hypothetical protein
MTRRRRGRRPGELRDGDDRHGQGQPRVGPDGRPDERAPRQPSAYTPPPSPLTRWQHHGQARRGGAAREQRPRWSPASAGPRSEYRGGPSQGRPRGFSPGERPEPHRNVEHQPAARPRPGGTIDPFELFCAYHLGITPDDGYRIQNIHEVARRFGTNAGELRQTLSELGMAADDIVHSGFDLPSAQVDIMVAPQGISRRELARPLYDEFRNAPKKTRDWAREMEDAQRQIDETIGRDGRWSPTPRDPAGKQP